jgi:hypothetical protein
LRTKQGKTIPKIPKNVVITVVVKITQNDGVVMAILVSASNRYASNMSVSIKYNTKPARPTQVKI